jgi:HAD superfamily hydrolase (TIGR01450 family)
MQPVTIEPHTYTALTMNHSIEPQSVDVITLIKRHEAIFLDAYGVLVDGKGPLPHAPELIAELNRQRVNYWILSNDASRLPETSQRRFSRFGMEIPAERIISSGSLLSPLFAERNLRGSRCVVLGAKDSAQYVLNAGGVVLTPDVRSTLDVLVVCDEAGYPLLETIETVLTMLFLTVDQGIEPVLLLPNPDLIYPKTAGQFGITAGSVALVLESALGVRYPASSPRRFLKLGKPHRPLFERALALAGTRNAVMIGDQLYTDVLGAHGAGIPSALVTTGLTRTERFPDPSLTPTYLLPTLELHS